MNINPISFKGVYHYTINPMQEPEKFNKVVIAKYNDEGIGGKIVIEHQNYDSIAVSLDTYSEQNDDVPSVNWLLSHAKNSGIKLPKYLSQGEYNIYVITDKDQEDYEKTLEKRERPLMSKLIVDKISRKIKRDPSRDKIDADVFLRRIQAFDELEQKKFDDFLKDREVEPGFIKVDENDMVHFLVYAKKS